MSSQNEATMQVKTILLATDFLQNSRLALDYAVALAHHYGAKLKILNVFELGPEAQNVEIVDHKPSRTRRDAEARLQAFASGIDRLGVSAEWSLVEGTVPRAILKSVSEYHADLLITGTQGVHRGISHLLIGSNTEEMMLTCPCPTLTIGPHVPGGIGLEIGFRTIIYISDFTTASAIAAPIVEGLSRDFSAAIEIYQLLPEAARNEPGQARRLAEQYCAQLTTANPQWRIPEFQLERIRSPQAVMERVMDSSALIVLGVQSASCLGRHLHTSFAYRLLADAACPVLTCRT